MYQRVSLSSEIYRLVKGVVVGRVGRFLLNAHETSAREARTKNYQEKVSAAQHLTRRQNGLFGRYPEATSHPLSSRNAMRNHACPPSGTFFLAGQSEQRSQGYILHMYIQPLEKNSKVQTLQTWISLEHQSTAPSQRLFINPRIIPFVLVLMEGPYAGHVAHHRLK